MRLLLVLIVTIAFAFPLSAQAAGKGGGSGTHTATTNTNKPVSNTVASSDKSQQSGGKSKGKSYLKYKLGTVFTTK